MKKLLLILFIGSSLVLWGNPGDTIIIDNVDPEVALDGSWKTGTSASGKYGANYFHDDRSGDKSAFYKPAFSKSGYYKLYEWHPANDLYANTAPLSIISNSDTLSTILYSQREDGGQFNYMGTFFFNDTLDDGIVLGPGIDGNYLIADAFRWIYHAEDINDTIILDDLNATLIDDNLISKGGEGYNNLQYIFPGGGSDSLIYTFTPRKTGFYNIFKTYLTTHDNRSNNTPIDISSGGVTTRIILDQSVVDTTPHFDSLGLQYFEKGQEVSIIVHGEDVPSDRYVVADAFFMYFQGEIKDTVPPTKPANIVIDNITDTSALVSWSPSTDDVLVKDYTLFDASGNTITTTSGYFLCYFRIVCLSRLCHLYCCKRFIRKSFYRK